ncbi:hypothetical protein ABZ924_34310 [Streptomyces sp. NPDC046876]|uniref:hypothetical protein n=1 Tax=Streptomyces sp. NPDC046876 TaxID=3155616 RepID=UPI00341027EE
MVGFSAGQRRLRVGVAVVAVGCAVGLVGCTSAKTDQKSARARSSAAPVPVAFGKEQAEKVVNQWQFQRKNALERRDSDAIAVVETGVLLAEDQAWM